MNKHFISKLCYELKDIGYPIDTESLTQAINRAEGKGSSERFGEFWRVFPRQRRRDKPRCIKQWAAKRLDTIADDIIEDVVYKKANDWEWNMGFAPMPSTYLNGRRWEDDITMPQTREDLRRYTVDTGKVYNGPVPKELQEEQSDWVDTLAPKGGW